MKGTLRCAVDRYVERKVVEHQMQTAGPLCELLFIRDDHLVLPNNVGFTCEEHTTYISSICTNIGHFSSIESYMRD